MRTMNVDMFLSIVLLSKFDIIKILYLALYVCFIYLLNLDTIDTNLNIFLNLHHYHIFI